MITNLVATIVISLATNVSSFDNGVRGPDYLISDGNWHPTRIITPATERTEVESVVEVRTLVFEVEGKKHSVELSNKEVRRTAKTFKLLQEWKLTATDTNVLQWSTTITNAGLFKQ